MQSNILTIVQKPYDYATMCCYLSIALALFLFQESKGDYVRYDHFIFLMFGDAVHLHTKC